MISVAFLVLSTSIGGCTIANAVHSEYMENLSGAARFAERRLDLIQEFREWHDAQGFEPGKPIGSQMDVEARAEFDRLQAALKSGMIKSLIESRRQRDLQVLAKMAELAEKLSKGELQTPEDKSEDLVLLAILYGMREVLPDVELVFHEEEPRAICTVDAAIDVAQADSMNTLEQFDIDEVSSQIDRLKDKYVDLTPESMSSADAALFRVKILPLVQHLNNLRMYWRDLERIQLLNGVSAQLRELNLNDVVEYGPDPHSLGKTWASYEANGEISVDRVRMGKVWTIINEQFPPEVLADWEELGRVLKKTAD